MTDRALPVFVTEICDPGSFEELKDLTRVSQLLMIRSHALKTYI